jgi:CDGSH-type Zn-finger protein
MSTKPVIADTKPVEITLESSSGYSWCACGRSEGQPFCDGTHKGGDIKPLRFKAGETQPVWLCMCKQTKTPPYCDGSHKMLDD